MFRDFLIFLCFLGSQAAAQEYTSCFLNGQLGNQLFQIAASIGYALDHGCEATFPDVQNALNGELNYRYIFHRLNTSPLPDHVEFQTFKEAHSNLFAPIPYQEGQNIRLLGHFESEKYFVKYKEYIRELFSPTQEILDQIYDKYGELLQETTVAVHIRTFIPDNRDPNSSIGGGNWNYFRAAMAYFPKDVHFVVFSDAMEWTKPRFPSLPHHKITFIEGNPHYIDFYLMSLCKHQIVSPESTFSWWAAWLNKNPDKIVILADIWNDLRENDTIPPGWIAIPKKPKIPFTINRPR